jgi:TctA family transporter
MFGFPADLSRRAMLLANGDLGYFLQRSISAIALGLCALLVAGQAAFWLLKRQRAGTGHAAMLAASE